MLTNLLEETEYEMHCLKKTWDDVEVIISNNPWSYVAISIDDFRKHAKTVEFDDDNKVFETSAYHIVSPYLIVKFKDNTWIERDHNEEHCYSKWIYQSPPRTPTTTEQFNVAMLRY